MSAVQLTYVAPGFDGQSLVDAIEAEINRRKSTLGRLGGFIKELVDTAFGPMFALGFSTALRNARANQITAQLDAGAGAALFRIYDGTRPATGGTATNLLAELTCSDPSAAGAASGVLTLNSITPDSAANADGTATWARMVDSNATFVMDMDVGTSGSDLNLNTVAITTGVQVDITSAVFTEGNA